MQNRKRKTRIQKLRLRRSKAVLGLMAAAGLEVADVAKATGLKVPTVYKAIEDTTPSPTAIAYLERRLGEPFRRLWYDFPEARSA